MENIIMERSITCLYNPRVGYENVYPVGKRAEKSKRILVIGGGVAGMEAARVAALRGHEVCLYEKSPSLGGQLPLAAAPPGRKEFLSFLCGYDKTCLSQEI
jgi:NADPH-dependent 2,4-dienoyl-CoA reductase/sulfur reductase-like enzyme